LTKLEPWSITLEVNLGSGMMDQGSSNKRQAFDTIKVYNNYRRRKYEINKK